MVESLSYPWGIPDGGRNDYVIGRPPCAVLPEKPPEEEGLTGYVGRSQRGLPADLVVTATTPFAANG